MQSFTSLVISAIAKPMSKLRGRIARGNLSSLAVLRPLLALMTSIITCGSSPALTPHTTASDVAAMLVADRRLLRSFIIWPMPGSGPM